MSELTESNAESTEPEVQQSLEDKFFGVKTQIGKKSEDKKADEAQADLGFEIVEISLKKNLGITVNEFRSGLTSCVMSNMKNEEKKNPQRKCERKPFR